MKMAVSGSPESDIGSFECFQNYTAPEVFVQGLAGQINQQDVEAIIRAQKQMLQRFEKTNEMLSNCNSLSNSRLTLAQKELKRHTTLLHDMKKDLDNVFKRIRTLKTKLASQYPSAYAEVQNSILKEENEDEGERNLLVNANPEAASANESSCTDPRCSKPISDTASDGHAEKNMIQNEANSSSCDSMSSNSGKISSSSSFDN